MKNTANPVLNDTVVKLLFVHQNFPGQFVHLAPALAADAANEVVALSRAHAVEEVIAKRCTVWRC